MMSSKRRRLTCAAMALLLACSCGWCEGEPTLAPVTEPPATQAPMPTEKAPETAAPVETLTAEPTAVPSQEADAVPTELPAESPSSEPGAEATPAPSFAPSAEPSEAPDPSGDPSPAPSATPSPTPAAGLRLTVKNGVPNEQQIYQLTLAGPGTPITFTWTAIEGAQSYRWNLTDAQGNPLPSNEQENPVFSGEQSECELLMDASALGTALTYMLRVQAIGSEAVLAEESILFQLVQQDLPGNPSGSFPGGFGGGRPGGAGEMPGAEQGFQVTPGQALTSSHSSGSKSMRLDGALDLETSEESQTELTLGGASLSVTLDAGVQSFTAGIDGDVLTLRPTADGECWQINAGVLKTLRRSGIGTLQLLLNGEAHSISTALEMCGSAYGALRAQGYVSKDFEILLTAQGTSVRAADETYLLAPDGTLTPQ